MTQAQRLLGADMAYLSLNDDERRETRMRVMVGATSSVWKDVPIPFGTGVGGMVAATGAPFSTSDYFADDRLAHDPAVDASVRAERQVSIVGVPLMRDGTVIGVLFAANREVGRFSHDAIALLGSFAALAALAIDQAHLMSDKERALAALRQANEALERRTVESEKAVTAHDRSMEIVLRGGGVQEVVAATGDQLGGVLAMIRRVAVRPSSPNAGTRRGGHAGDARGGERRGRALGRSGRDGAYWVTRLVAGTEDLVHGLGPRRPPATTSTARTGSCWNGRRSSRPCSGCSTATSPPPRPGCAVSCSTTSSRRPRTPGRPWRSGPSADGFDPRKRHAIVVAHVLPDVRPRLGSAAADLAAARNGLSTLRDGLAVLVVPSDDPSLTGRQVSPR